MLLTPYDIAAYVYQKGFVTDRSLRGDYRCQRPPFSENEISPLRDFGKDVMNPLMIAGHLGMIGKGRLDIAPNRLNRRVFYARTDKIDLKYHLGNIAVARGIERALINAGHQIVGRKIMPSSSIYHRVITKWNAEIEIRTSDHFKTVPGVDFYIDVLYRKKMKILGLGKLRNSLRLNPTDIDPILDTFQNLPEPLFFSDIRKDAPCVPIQSNTAPLSSLSPTMSCS